MSEFRYEPAPDSGVEPEALRRACERMIGRGTGGLEGSPRACLSLEEYFEGNGDAGSIGANKSLAPPLDTLEGWYRELARLRGLADLREVVIWNSTIEPYEGGRIADWPFTDSVVVVTALEGDEVAEAFRALEPDEVLTLESPEDLERSGFVPLNGREQAFQVWWE